MRRRSYPRDPYWLTARYNGKCGKCGGTVKKGERAFYYPNDRVTLWREENGQMKLSILRSQADAGARWREHLIHWEPPTRHDDKRETQRGVCETCGAEVLIDTRPAPNSIDIGGTAVALNCEC